MITTAKKRKEGKKRPADEVSDMAVRKKKKKTSGGVQRERLQLRLEFIFNIWKFKRVDVVR